MSTPRIAIVMASHGDWTVMSAAAEVLDELDIPYHLEVVSAHRTPMKTAVFANAATEAGMRAIIAGSGGAAHLPGMLAAQTLVPVIGVPIPDTPLLGIDAMFSIAQMQAGVPVATLGIGRPGASDAAFFAASILAAEDRIAEALSERRPSHAEGVLAHPDPRAELS